MTENQAEGDERPCSSCPWVSRDERDREATAMPTLQAAVERGEWFCCHVNMGTCHGARLLHERHVRKTAALSAPPATTEVSDVE